MTVTKMMIFFCIAGALLLALIPHVIWLIQWIISFLTESRAPYRYFGFSAVVLVLIFWGAMAYGYYIGRWKVESVEIEYAHKDIPKAFNGFKIVHISDLHLSTFDDDRERFMTFIDEINRHNPDIICFTGDMVTIGRSEAEPYTDMLKQLKARHGVLSVLGNHDFMIYGFGNGDRESAVIELASYQEEVLGWNLLRNENTVITAEDGSTLTFIGVDNANFSNQGFKTINRSDLAKAMEDTEGFRILLSHDPSHWRAEVIPDTDIPLTLSGHTHNAQVKILGWTPASVTFKETAGRYDHKDSDNGDTCGTNGEVQTLYINIGLGCTAPFRLGANPEVTLITLKSK